MSTNAVLVQTQAPCAPLFDVRATTLHVGHGRYLLTELGERADDLAQRIAGELWCLSARPCIAVRSNDAGIEFLADDPVLGPLQFHVFDDA